jgi:hypothetical protein
VIPIVPTSFLPSHYHLICFDVCVCVFVFIVNIFFLLCQITTTMQKYHQSLLRTSYYRMKSQKRNAEIGWPFAERERERERENYESTEFSRFEAVYG